MKKPDNATYLQEVIKRLQGVLEGLKIKMPDLSGILLLDSNSGCPFTSIELECNSTLFVINFQGKGDDKYFSSIVECFLIIYGFYYMIN